MALRIEDVEANYRRLNVVERGVTEERGNLLIFRMGVQRVDMKAYTAFREGNIWSLPASYRRSYRRGIFVDNSDMYHPVKVSLKIVGEEVGSWYLRDDGNERHVLDSNVYVAGEYPQLGSSVQRPWSTGKETVIGRVVYISYNPQTLEPKVIVKDRIPKRGVIGDVRYCDKAGVPSEKPAPEYFGVGFLDSRFPQGRP